MKKSIYSILIFVTGLAIVLPTYSMDFYAVCVGIKDYADPYNDCPYADYDAQDIREVLINKQGYATGNLNILINSQATKDAILSAVGNMPKNSSTTCVYSDAGHGSCTGGFITYNNGYLITPGMLENAFGSYNQYCCILDHCKSGAFPKNMDHGFIMSACDDDELAYGLYTLQNGVFTHYVVAALNSTGTYAEKVFDYAKPRTTNMISSQHPKKSDNYPGYLYLFHKPPQNLTITNSTQIGLCPNLSWSVCPGCDSYKVYRKTVFTEWTLITTTTNTSYTDMDIIISDSYSDESFYYYVKASYSGKLTYPSNTVSILGETFEQIEDIKKVLVEETVPEKYGLSQSYPNPANPSTFIEFTLPEASDIHLAIYNLRGQIVNVLMEGPIQAGFHHVVWDGVDKNGNALPSGLYVYRLKTGSKVFTRKLSLMK